MTQKRAASVRPLVALAWVNVVLHVTGLALAAVGIRPGSPLVPLEGRLAYLAGAHVAWTTAWITWMFCAAALVAFLAVLRHRLGERAVLAQIGLTVAVTGAAFDLFCDSVYLLVLPMLASQPDATALFLTVERVTGIGSLVIANGAYCVAILLFAQALRARQGLTPLTTALGYAVGGCGLLLAGAGFTGVPQHAEWLTPPTMGLFCLWVVLVARSLEPAGRSP